MGFIFVLFFSISRLIAGEQFCANDISLINQHIKSMQTADINRLKDNEFLQERINYQKISIKNNGRIDYVYFLKTSHHYRILHSHLISLKKDEKKLNILITQYHDDDCQENKFGNILSATSKIRRINYFGVKIKDLQKILISQAEHISNPLTSDQILYLIPNIDSP